MGAFGWEETFASGVVNIQVAICKREKRFCEVSSWILLLKLLKKNEITKILSNGWSLMKFTFMRFQKTKTVSSSPEKSSQNWNIGITV